MKRLIMDIDKLFTTFQKEAFRIECLPSYDVDSEKDAIENFNKTGLIDDGLNDDWLEIIRAASERRARIKRLRLLSRPLTDYEKFELVAYQKNLEAGEDIRYIYRDDCDFQQDFWVFDMKWISIIRYDDNGKFLDISTREVTKKDLQIIQYYKKIFTQAAPINNLISKP